MIKIIWKTYRFYVLIAVLVISNVSTIVYYNFNKQSDIEQLEIGQDFISEVTLISVDIKGAVKTPGVYKLNNGSNVLDVINMAGGLTKNASTKNINLSRIINDQSVIYISTAKELSKLDAINVIKPCVCEEPVIKDCIAEPITVITPVKEVSGEETKKNNVSTSNTETKSLIVSLNNGTQEDLMTLSGIGEAKAKSIINYRETNGLFKDVTDIKNVSGISDSIYEKIKDFIKL